VIRKIIDQKTVLARGIMAENYSSDQIHEAMTASQRQDQCRKKFCIVSTSDGRI